MEVQEASDRPESSSYNTGATQEIVLVCGDARILIDPEEAVFVAGKRIDLTTYEHALFIGMAQRPGEIISKDELCEFTARSMTLASLTAAICKIRKKLAKRHPDAASVIRTWWDRGFGVIAQDEGSLPASRTRHRLAIPEGELVIDKANEAYVGTMQLMLTPSEADLLELLVSRPGMVWTKTALLNSLYGTDDIPELKIFDVVVCKINRKFEGLFPGKALVQVAWGRGHYVGEPRPDPDADITAVPVSDRKVAGPTGAKISKDDLPNDHVRWVVSRKATIVVLVEKGIVPLPYVLARYPGLTKGEYGEWKELIDAYGMQGLRTTKSHLFPIAA